MHGCWYVLTQLVYSIWLTSVHELVLSLHPLHCISDLFAFVDTLCNFALQADCFLCSFNVSSRFTNFPLTEINDITANALGNRDLPTSSFPSKTFVELNEIVTTGVEFNFTEVMYKQIDGVAMETQLLQKIFIGFYKTKLFSNAIKSHTCHCYVDGTYGEFNSERV